MSNSRPPFVLLIAIDQYSIEAHNLKGAKKDAAAVKQYAEEHLGLRGMPSRIRTLYDSSATRQAIINELKNLASSEEIEKGDPIIILYAGHGCELDAPAGWESSGNVIQGIVPHDFNKANLDTAIPDRTIGALLEDIANAKGDNITLICDCCHSGSISRDTPISHGTIRGIGKRPGIMSPHVDEQIWAHRGRSPVKATIEVPAQDPVEARAVIDSAKSGLGRESVDLASTNESIVGRVGLLLHHIWQEILRYLWFFVGSPEPSQAPVDPTVDAPVDAPAQDPAKTPAERRASHVLLAACGAKEQAREYENGGVFTLALLEALITVGHNQVTYTELIDRLPLLNGQNPQCEGHNRRRICFDSKAPVPKRTWFGIKATLPGQKVFEVEAGTAHGITDGAKFAVYSSRTPRSDADLLAHVTVSTVYLYRCEVEVASGSLPTNLEQAAAAQTHVGTQEDLRLYIPEGGRENAHLNIIYTAIEAGNVQVDNAISAAPWLITFANEAEAELGIILKGTDIMVEILDQTITVHGLRYLQGTIPPQLPMTTLFLQRAAHYHRYLHRVRGNKQGSVSPDHIKVDFARLEAQGDFFQRVGENLIKDGVIDIPARAKVFYGIKLINNSNKDLFPSVFFFNALDLSIDSIYECAAAKSGKLDCPLPAHGGCLTIGYGSGGSRPMFFYLENGQDIEVSLLKVFVSDRYVDMGDVAQNSAFDTSSGDVAKRKMGRFSELDHGEGELCTTLVSLVVRRPT